jgi:AraC family ethanolamine operon transcriptional activator
VDELANAGCIETEDIDEHRQVLQPWDLVLRQMSPGPFRARLEYAQVNGILLYREHWTRRVMGNGGTPSGYVMLGCPTSARTRIDWCGGEVHSGRLACGKSSSEVDFAVPDGSEHVALLVPEGLLQNFPGEEAREAASIRDRYHLRCDMVLGDELVGLTERLIDAFLARPELLTDARLCKAVQWQLLGILVQVIRGSDSSAGAVSAPKRRQAFRRAIEYVEELDRPVAVPEVAAASGVSQRVLELAFRDTLNTTPSKYMRWNRLNRARKALLAAEEGSTSVKEIANRSGFSEPGRFAVEYKHLFDESPSETLASTPRSLPGRLADTLRE